MCTSPQTRLAIPFSFQCRVLEGIANQMHWPQMSRPSRSHTDVYRSQMLHSPACTPWMWMTHMSAAAQWNVVMTTVSSLTLYVHPCNLTFFCRSDTDMQVHCSGTSVATATNEAGEFSVVALLFTIPSDLLILSSWHLNTNHGWDYQHWPWVHIFWFTPWCS